MRILILSICFLCISFSAPLFAEGMSEPVISHNVPVMQNSSPSQCPTSWRGAVSPEAVTDLSDYGIDTGVEMVGVQSCSSCAFDQTSGNCICGTCYGYYN